jgi:hypothetical protein
VLVSLKLAVEILEENVNKSQLGGIFSIVSGALGALSGFLVIVYMIFMAVMFSTISVEELGGVFTAVFVIYSIVALGCIALGVLAIVGGVFSLKKIRWGWALAGAISASMSFFPLGIAAIVLVAMSQAEFGKPVQVQGEEAAT